MSDITQALVEAPAPEPLYVILNGPPGSGKSTARRHIATRLHYHDLSVLNEEVARPIKHFLASCLGRRYNDLPKAGSLPPLPVDLRTFLVDLSDQYIKPRYGAGIFAKLLRARVAHLCQGNKFDICLIDDGGAGIDEQTVLREAPRTIVIGINRPGCDWIDNRIPYANREYTITNDGHFNDLIRQCTKIADAIALSIKTGTNRALLTVNTDQEATSE